MSKVVKKIDMKMCIKAAVWAVCTVFCFCVKNGTYRLTQEQIDQYGGWLPAQFYRLASVFASPSFVYAVLFALLVCVYIMIFQRMKFIHVKLSILISGCYALCILLGESYFVFDSWICVFGNGFAVFTSLLRGTGIALLCFIVLQFIWRIQITPGERMVSVARTFAKIALVLVICWLPYMIIMFPGAMNPDTRDQVAQITGNSHFCFTARMIRQDTAGFLWNNNHPVLFTLILKGFVSLGGFLGSYAWGFEIYSVLQSLAWIAVIAYMLTKLRSYGLSRKILLGFVCFFALNPLFPLWGMTTMKDVPFTIFLLLSLIQLYEILSGRKKAGVKELALLGGLLLFMMLFRNNGLFMVLLTLPFLVIMLWKERKKMLGVAGTFLLTAVVFKVVITGLLFTALGIGSGSTGEMLSVPFQQTARYIKEHRQEVTAEEEKAILAVLNTGGTLDEIADLYVPYRADQVKAKYNPLSSTAELKGYIQVWFKQFVKHPSVYVQAYLNLAHCWFGMEGKADNIYYSDVDPYIQQMLPGVTQPKALTGARKVINGYIKLLDSSPLTSWLLEFSVYTWVYIILFAVMIIRRKAVAFLTIMMIFANYIICLAGPVGYMRYAIPMIICLPFAIILTFASGTNKTTEKRREI